MARRYLAAVAAIALAGCATQEPRLERTTIHEASDVAIPVPGAPCTIESALLDPLPVELPTFVAGCGDATSALTAEGETRFQLLVAAFQSRISAWEAWARECGAPE